MNMHQRILYAAERALTHADGLGYLPREVCADYMQYYFASSPGSKDERCLALCLMAAMQE